MRETLLKGLPALGLDTSLVPVLEQFAGILLERNRVMNLTAITGPRDVAALHLLDSLALAQLAGLRDENVVDVGTGAGFPGLPLAAALGNARFTLLDSLGKRVDFLRDACEALGLENAVCVQARAEEFAGDQRESFDCAVSRAVADLPVLCELCLPLVRVGGRFLAMKSSHCDEEVQRAGAAIRALGGQLGWVRDYTVPTTDVVHRVVCVEKVSPTPRRFPRRFAQIKKQPLG